MLQSQKALRATFALTQLFSEQAGKQRDIDKRLERLDTKDILAKSLKACPFCGAELKKFPGVMIFEQTQKKEAGKISADMYAVKCPRCGGQGGSDEILEIAANKWNRREC